MGTFLYLICGISFFTLGHCLKFKRWYLEAFLVTGMVVCSIGIMQYFLLDPFGLKKDIHASHYTSFISTVGNINTYASYIWNEYYVICKREKYGQKIMVCLYGYSIIICTGYGE